MPPPFKVRFKVTLEALVLGNQYLIVVPLFNSLKGNTPVQEAVVVVWVPITIGITFPSKALA